MEKTATLWQWRPTFSTISKNQVEAELRREGEKAADSVLGIYVRETLLLIAPTATSTPNNIKSGNTVARKVNSGDTTEVELSAWQLKQQMIKKHGENPQE